MTESPWTVDTLREYFSQLIAERDRRHDAENQALQQAIQAAKEAVGVAMTAAKEAVIKAETAAEKRFEGVNEFRAQLGDQQRTLMPRAEAEIRFNSVMDQLAKLDQRVASSVAQTGGVREGWGYAAGVIGLVLFLLSIVSAVIVFTKNVGP